MNMTLQTLPVSALVAGVLGISQAQGAATIYEPFDYNVGNLGNNGPATGLSGTYENDTRYRVISGSLSYGSLVTSDNSMSITSDAGGMNQMAIDLSSDLANAGLLDDGTAIASNSLWFSFLHTADNVSNDEFGFALGSEEWDPGLTSLLDGIGVVVNSTGSMSARFFDADSYAGTSSGSLSVIDGTTRLIVGHIEWGESGANDTLSLYAPGTDMVLGSAFSTASFIDNQSVYDTLTFTARNNSSTEHTTIDEIRFGATLADVTPVPEPSAALLGAVGALLLLRRRK